MKWINRGLMMFLAVMLAACNTVSIVKMEAGEQNTGRMQVKLDNAWNHVVVPASDLPNIQRWTMEGIGIDTLMVYSGIKNGEAMNKPANSKKPVFAFRSDMQADQIVALYESLYTSDGSVFKLNRLEPSAFGGGKGFHFEYSVIRKDDNVELHGIASAIVDQGELFAVVYHAPKLAFFPRQQAQVRQIMGSVKISNTSVVK